MDRKKQRLVEASVSDAITEKPLTFSLGDKEFTIHPPTLGKMQILAKHYLELDINEDDLDKEPILEAMRICEGKTDAVCRLMAVATFNEKGDLLDDKKISERADFFKWNSNPEHFIMVILKMLAQSHYANFMNSIRLTETFRINTEKVSKRPGRVE